MADELTSSDKPGRRTNQVKVTLNDSELALLDELVERSGTTEPLYSDAAVERLYRRINNPGAQRGLPSEGLNKSRPPVFLSEPRHLMKCHSALMHSKRAMVNKFNDDGGI